MWDKINCRGLLPRWVLPQSLVGDAENIPQPFCFLGAKKWKSRKSYVLKFSNVMSLSANTVAGAFSGRNQGEPMYNKLWSKILDSSVWLTDKTTRIVWVTFLASMDKNSFAHFSSVRNLARRANVTDEEAETAVAVLESPDPESETPADDGRRIRRVPGGWLIVNGEKYNKTLIEQHKKELNRARVKKHRAKFSNDETPVMRYSITGNENTCSESESESESCAERFQLPLNDGTLFPITDNQIAKWNRLYPAVDVEQSIRSMIGWSESNPTKRKTSRGIQRFINSWLDREQNRPRPERNNGNGKKQSSFGRLFGSDEAADS